MSVSGADVIKLKDDIHTKWFELQRAKQSNAQYAFLPKLTYDEIIALGHQALEIVKQIQNKSQYIRRIQYPLFEVERKSWNSEDVVHLGAPPKQYYAMKPGVAQQVIIRDINQLANQVHLAGMSLIKATGGYCGCFLTEDVKLSAINTGVLRYCEGALQRGHADHAWVIGEGDRVEHRPGNADKHATIVQFTPAEKGHELDVEYNESGDCQWEQRQKGVLDYLNARGAHCSTHELNTRCHVSNLDDDEVRKLALMISQLKDIDLMTPDCIPLAFQLIERQADELKALEPKSDIYKEKWTEISDFREIMECFGKSLPAEQEERKRDLAERLKRDIEKLVDDMEHAISVEKNLPCTEIPYRVLRLHNNVPGIQLDCKNLKTQTNEPWAWCEEIVKQKGEEVQREAKALINRCPPEGIILGLEAQGRGFSISVIEDMCTLAKNDDCLAIIDQVKIRKQAGIKAAKLPLGSAKPFKWEWEKP